MSAQQCSVVTADRDGMRLDAYLADVGAFPSRSAAVKSIDAGDVLVGGVIAVKKTLVYAGDAVVYTVPEQEKHVVMQGQDIPLDVRYEDDYLAVISKQAGLICHPSIDHSDGTLVNALIHRYGRDNLAHVQGDDRPGIVHRLDGDTSGLMLCAMDDATGEALQEAIRLREVDRRYITLVHGTIGPDSGEIDAPIMRNPRDRQSMTVGDGPSSREALTTFHVLERFEAAGKDDGFSLVECKLFTGRTHQIRVHMRYIHHCCVGDATYGSFAANLQLGLNRQFLHSYRLAFDHPVTGEHLQFSDTLPADLQQALDKLSKRTIGRTDFGIRMLGELEFE